MNRKRRRTAAKARRGATPASTGASAFEAGDTLRKAQALHESGRFEDAAALYERILGQDPRRSDAFHRIGVDAVDKGAYGAGAALIRKAIEANPAVASYHVDPAPALEHQGRLEETVEACRRARLWQHRLPRLSGPPVDGQA
ncbi:MAG: tetratricopeptide repeat protein [Alphaproteobacteria bacterium]